MTFRLLEADCIQAMAEMEEASVDAIVTDPPYGLEFMGKEWDRLQAVAADPASVGGFQDGNGGNSYSRARVRYALGAGMQDWHQAWATEALRVLKPGGHLLAFGGTRTYHRLACALEDAGFEIRDCLAWLYGSGFPKSLDVSKAIDKRGGNPQLAEQIAVAIREAREARGWTTRQADEHFCGGSTNWTWFEGRPAGCRPPTPADFARIVSEWPELASWAQAVAEVEREVIGTIRKDQPGGTSAFAEGGIGAYQRGDKTERPITGGAATSEAQKWQGWGTALKPAFEPIVLARKPLIGSVAQNVLTYGTGGLNIDGTRIEADYENEPGRGPGWLGSGHQSKTDDAWQGPAAKREGSSVADRVSSLGRWPPNVLLDEEAAAQLDEMTGELPPGFSGRNRGWQKNGYVGGESGIDQGLPGMGYGDTGGASRFFYVAKADREERNRGLEHHAEKSVHPPSGDGRVWDIPGSKSMHRANNHPTVKPVELMQWLVKLVTPPGGTVLDPFAGSGSTLIAACREGFDCIGIEREAEYVAIARDRIIGDGPLFNVEVVDA